MDKDLKQKGFGQQGPTCLFRGTTVWRDSAAVGDVGACVKGELAGLVEVGATDDLAGWKRMDKIYLSAKVNG